MHVKLLSAVTQNVLQNQIDVCYVVLYSRSLATRFKLIANHGIKADIEVAEHVSADVDWSQILLDLLLDSSFPIRETLEDLLLLIHMKFSLKRGFGVA